MKPNMLLGIFATLIVLIIIAVPGRTAPTPASADTLYRLLSQGTTITGQQGKVLRVTAAPAAGGGPVARHCYEINSNAFYVSVVDMTEVPAGDICGSTTAVAMLPSGDYIVTAGVYPAGSQVPDKETHLPFTIFTFDRAATIEGAALSREQTGDANCDGIVNGPDLIAVLRKGAAAPPYASCIESANVTCHDPLGAGDALVLVEHLAGIAVSLGDCPRLLDPPALISPPDGVVYDYFPRTTDVVWDAVDGAAEYVVYVDAHGCDNTGRWCSEVGEGYLSNHTTGTSFEFGFIGSGFGRWRVAAIGADGRAGPFSEWRGFRYLQ